MQRANSLPWTRRPGTLRLAACLLAGLVALGSPAAPSSKVSVIDPEAHYPEGPLWRDGALFYVEYSANNVKKWDGRGVALYWHQEGCGPSGLIEFGGHLLIACYDSNSLVELDARAHEIRAWRKDIDGKPFAGPNDFAADGRGGIYFTASGQYDLKAPITGAVLHLSADGGTIRVLADTIHYSNGLTLSKDGKQLLVAEMLAGRILSFPLNPDGSLGPRTVWARLADLAPPTPGADAYNGPDGLKLGPDGNYYIAQNGSGRVLVVDDNRHLVRKIEVPTPFVTNMAFGADGGRTVFITGAFEQWKPPFPGKVYSVTP